MPPTACAPKPERDNLQWIKLKTYILNRRNEEIQEKEKEEELTNKRKIAEEEYLKTKEELEKVQKEINEKNNLLKQYGDEKHELFSQLKKVLLDDDNRKRIESEKNEHNTLLLNNLNHSNQAQIFISQAPLSNNTIQPIPLNSSSIYKLPNMTTATAITPQHSINNKRTRSPSPLPNPAIVHQPQLHPSYASYKHPTSGNAALFNVQHMKLNEEQQKHIALSHQQQQLRQQQQQQQQQHHQQGPPPTSSQSNRGAPPHHQNNEYIQRNIMNWQQQQQQQQKPAHPPGNSNYQHYFPPGQHLPQPRSNDTKPGPIFVQQQQQQQHQRSSYDDKYHFQIRLPSPHNKQSTQQHNIQNQHTPTSGGSVQHGSGNKGSITAGYPIRMPNTRVVTNMIGGPPPNSYHAQNMHKFNVPHSQGNQK